MEYLVTMTTLVPDGTPDQAVAEIRARKAARSRELAAQGFLTTFTLTIPGGTPQRVADDTIASEAQAARALAGQGHLLRLWRLAAGGPGALGLWRARDAAERQAILESLPLYSWMIVQTTPLTRHPSDPVPATS